MYIGADTKRITNHLLLLLQDELRIVSRVQETLEQWYDVEVQNPYGDVAFVREQLLFWGNESHNIQQRIAIMQYIVDTVEAHINRTSVELSRAAAAVRAAEGDV